MLIAMPTFSKGHASGISLSKQSLPTQILFKFH